MKTIKIRLLALMLCAAVCFGCLTAMSGCASLGESNGTIPTVSQPTEKPDDTGKPEDEPEPEEIIPLDCNPLTGQKLENGTTDLRPVAVMLDNSSAALPHSGIAAASVVYEMVTEGGIPRLMAVFPSAAAIPGKLGPVRSTRDQFVQLLIPENMILLHIGCSVYAADMLNAHEYPTVDGIYLGNIIYGFDEVRAATRDNSHCFYTNNELAAAGIAYKEIAAKGSVDTLFRFVPYDKPVRECELPASTVEFSFSMSVPVSFVYNTETARYAKTEYGLPQMDEATGEQASYTNLLLLGCPVGLKSDELCTDFDFTGGGEGYYFTHGSCEKVQWKKGDVEDPLTLYTADGKQELAVNTGTSYVAFIDNRALEGTLLVDTVSPYKAE
ncbi:MAG: DUF3048 domain-containing protein [Oscillospiraceae bacterium]|nr:DUF3048 domain-containing protein [Oscillospiraceae bacterium]